MGHRVKLRGQEHRVADCSLSLRLSILMVCDKASDPSSLAEWFIHQNCTWVQHEHIFTQKLTDKLWCALLSSPCANGNAFILLM